MIPLPNEQTNRQHGGNDITSRSDYSCVEIAFKITTLKEGSSSDLMLSQLEWTVLIHFLLTRDT